MSYKIRSVITATGEYIPLRRVPNLEFQTSKFFNSAGEKNGSTIQQIIEKFEKLTTIRERRYVDEHLVTSDIAFFAAKDAIESANIDKEELDYIIVAHNFGDVSFDNRRSDIVPSIASRVKQKLEIRNPETVAYDLIFGCAGWLQAIIQADYFIKSGDARKILVIGSEVFSRVVDRYDIDSMLFADGAGATILEARKNDNGIGIIKHSTRSDTFNEAKFLHMNKSNNHKEMEDDSLFLKMDGRKLYQYALETVPNSIKDCIDKSGIQLNDIKYFLLHQANGKMNKAIIERLYALFGKKEVPNDIMPMTISWLGNSSVATIPILLNHIMKDKLKPYKINPGDKIVFASVGAGMNVNTMLYVA